MDYLCHVMTRRRVQERHLPGKRRWCFGGDGQEVGILAFMVASVGTWWRSCHRSWIVESKAVVWWCGSCFDAVVMFPETIRRGDGRSEHEEDGRIAYEVTGPPEGSWCEEELRLRSGCCRAVIGDCLSTRESRLVPMKSETFLAVSIVVRSARL